MALYSYVMTRDFGFAPNPFPPYCTLATCKPTIRRSANVGDWIVGFGSAAKNSPMKNRLIYAMQVEEKITYDQYWSDPRFFNKRPIMNGSNRQLYGDNIYHTDVETQKIIQENSHHSLDDGSININNYNRDIPGKYVLVSTNYWYWGVEAPLIPKEFFKIVKSGIGQKKIKDKEEIDNFFKWLLSFEERHYIGKPCQFSGEFKRYNGKN